jgi:SRSO17 transposase
MTEAQLNELAPALTTFLERFAVRFRSTPTVGHLHTYARGLLSELPRKTAEPIALAAGTPVRTLQEFLKDHLWDHDGIGSDVRCHVAQQLDATPADDLGTVGLLDETSALKKGDKTPGVSRQYLGCVGKVDDGIVTVHLGVCRGTYQTLIDADLFLPKCWSDDRTRCRAAGIPDAVVHRPKWRIALTQLDRARADGVKLDWLTFDSEYGRGPDFLRELDDRSQLFVGDVPRNFRCLAVSTSAARPEAKVKGRAAEEVVRNATSFRSQAWRVVRLSRQTAEDQLWRVKCASVWASGESGWSVRTYRLIWMCSEATGEEAFVLSNASSGCPVERLVRVAFCRSHVEHLFRISKSELGFAHFEGRSYVALMRHLCVCVAMMAFVAEHTRRLRGEKSRGDSGASLPGVEVSQRSLADADAGDGSAGVGVGGHRLPSASQPKRDPVQTTTRRSPTHTQKTENAKSRKTETVFSYRKVAL